MPITTLLLDGDGVLQYPPHAWPARMLALTGCETWGDVARVETPFMVGGDPTGAFERGFPDRTVSVAAILDAWNDTIVDAAALDLLDAVRARGVRCYLASNQQQGRAAYMRTLPLADHLDGLYFSCDLGIAKPDPAYFRAILDAAGATPSETLFVDDMPANVEGARSAGLIAAHKTGSRGTPALREILDAHGLL